MRNNIIYNQRFNKAANDIETIITEFRKLINQYALNPDDLVKIQLLKNEFKTATNSLLDEVESTDKTKVTILTELKRSDLMALEGLMNKTSYADNEEEIVTQLEFWTNVAEERDLLNQFVKLLQDLKEYSE